MGAKKIGENQWLVDVDSRGRVSLAKTGIESGWFRVTRYENSETIYLEPVSAYTDAEIEQLRYNEQQQALQEAVDNE